MPCGLVALVVATVIATATPAASAVVPATTDGGAAAAGLPTTLTDLRGRPVDVAALAAAHRVFVITLKATWCPVCQEQLGRLRALLPRLRSCGATFLVLAPGPADALRRIQQDTAFPYPFIEDRDLAIARALGLALDATQILPAILEVDRTGVVLWAERGRSGAAFNDDALLARLACPALRGV